MEQNRGILFLADPLKAGSAAQTKSEYTNSMTLIFDENGRYLSHAQAALWRMRQKYGWVCVAAEGNAACIAAALAVQLPVDRLALAGSGLFLPGAKRLPRELARLNAYARRNLSLVVSQILLIGAQEVEVRGFVKSCVHACICALEAEQTPWKNCQNILAAPWEGVAQNNLRIPWKCV
ncbi:MAG: hypothetical protein J6M10_07610 [Clostridia bacterium]|nr:hypothetical protein [Clostridia bacterium]